MVIEYRIAVDIQPSTTPGPVRAHATVCLEIPGGTLVLYGFSVIEKDGKAPWVGFPQKQGKTAGKYFPVVEAKGEIREQIAQEVLRAYQAPKAA